MGVEAEADWDHLRTPETYLGYRPGRALRVTGAAPYSTNAVPTSSPRYLHFNQWALAGEWTIGPEKVVLDQAGGSIAFRFDARDAHLVLSAGGARADPVPRAPRRRGSGPLARRGRRRGRATACSATAVMYQLVREHDAVRERTLEITFLEPGAEAYAFTFG